MTEPIVVDPVQIAPVEKLLNPIALGGFLFGTDPWNEQRAAFV